MNEKGGRGVEEKNSLPPSETIINKGSLRDLVEVEVKKKKNGNDISVDTRTNGEKTPTGSHLHNRRSRPAGASHPRIYTTPKGSHNKNNCTIVRHLRSRSLHSYTFPQVKTCG